MPFVLPSFPKHDNANHSENQCNAELAVTVSQNVVCGLFLMLIFWN